MAVKKVRVVLRWTGRTLLVLLAILALFILEENIRGRILLARYKAVLRAKGEKLTLAELDLPKPSSQTNGAATLLALADQIKKDAHETPEAGYIAEGLVFVKPGVAVVMHKQLAPVTHGYPSGLLEPCGSWDDDSNIAVTVDAELDQAEQVVRQGPVQFPLDYTEGIPIKLPHLNRIRYLGEWFAGTALVNLHNGRVDDALDSLQDVRSLADAIADEREQISQIERIKRENEVFDLAWEFVHADAITETQLARLQKICTFPDVTVDMQEAFEMQLVSYLQFFRQMRGYGWLTDLGRSLQPDRLVQGGWKHLFALPEYLTWRTSCLDQDECRALELWSDILRRAREAKGAACWSKARDVLPEEVIARTTLGSYDRWRFKLSSLLFGLTWHRYLIACFHNQTQRELALTAIALKRYELRRRHQASALQELVPEFLPSVPVDYMDGRQLRYQTNKDGTFALYSVGDDCVDDGGDTTPSVGHKSYNSVWDGRDAVWPMAATREEVEACSTKPAEQFGQR